MRRLCNIQMRLRPAPQSDVKVIEVSVATGRSQVPILRRTVKM